MDDSHTRRMLDSLADLFLTGARPKPSQPKADDAGVDAAQPSAPNRAPAPLPPPSPPTSMGTRSVADQLQGPNPIRLTPKVSHAPTTTTPQTPTGFPAEPQQPLRLRTDTRDDPGTRDEPFAMEDERQSPTETPIVEAVFLGSLPGFAAPWLTQYAQYLAEDAGGPVGLLHLDEEQIDLEVVGDLHADDLHDMDSESLSRTVAALSSVRHWLIHVHTPVTAPIMNRLRRVSQWTILSGADDAATVAAYRLIRQLLDVDAPDRAVEPLRQIGIMVMGSDDEHALQTADKINRATANFLDLPVQFLGAVKQMGPVSVQVLGSFEDRPEQWSAAIAHMLEPVEAESARPPRRRSPSRRTRPARRLTDLYVDRPMDHVKDVEPQPPSAPFVAGASPSDDDDVLTPADEAVAASPAGAAPAANAPTSTRASDDASAAADPDLSSFLPGGLALQARCPRHPQTQLVLDQDGRLHLLRRHNGPAADLYAAVIDLLEARAWVAEHLQLLQLTQRQCRFDASAESVLHLFTDQAKLAAALTARLGPFVRLHLLQKVHVGRESTWFCADLN